MKKIKISTDQEYFMDMMKNLGYKFVDVTAVSDVSAKKKIKKSKKKNK